jgi:hypothetical protein
MQKQGWRLSLKERSATVEVVDKERECLSGEQQHSCVVSPGLDGEKLRLPLIAIHN